MDENKVLITNYLRALSGVAKTPATIAPYVEDETLAAHIAQIEAAFPRYELQADSMIAEGNLVVVRGVFRGVHRGPFAGIDPTGRSVSAGIIIIYEIHNRRIVHHWMQLDVLGLLQQLQEKREAVSAG